MNIMTLRRALVLLAYTSTHTPSANAALSFRNVFRSASSTSTSSASSVEADGSNGVEHIVLLRVKPGTTKSQIKKFKEGIETLHTIPGVTSVTVGETFAERWMQDRRDGYTLGLRVRLESKKALQSYQDDELHTKVKQECIAPIAESAVAVDWESPLVLGKWQRL